jgi:hypothetical protein
MGIRTMVQFTVRVAAFAAAAALLLQISCMSGLPPATIAQLGTHSDSGCHESAPSAPHAPDSGHNCCSGDHSPDALLSTVVTAVPLISDLGSSDLTSPLRSFALSSTSTGFLDFSPPHGLLPLRI